MNENIYTQTIGSKKRSSYDVHLIDYVSVLRRRKWFIIIPFFIVVGFVTIKSIMMTPVYKATAQVIIEKQSFPVLDIEDKTQRYYREQDFYQTRYSLLSNRSLVCKVIESLESKDLRHIDDLLSAGNTVPRQAQASENPSSHPIDSKYIDWYLSHLEVEPVIKTSLVNISFLGPSPEFVTHIANKHVDLAIKQSIEMEQATAQQAYNWITEQIDGQKAKLEEAQRAIYKYRKKNKMLSLEKSENIISEEIIETNSALIKARTDRLAKQVAYKQLESFSAYKKALLPLPEVSGDYIIKSLRAQLVQLKAERMRMGSRFGPMHPKIIQIDSEITHLRREITSEIDRVKDSLKASLNRSETYEKSVKASLDAQKQKVMFLDKNLISYDELRQRVKSNLNQYDILLKHAKEIDLVRGRKNSDIRIIDKAEVPRGQIKPKIFLNFIIASILSFFIWTGLAFFMEYMDNTIKSPEDIIRHMQIPILGTMPYDKSLDGPKRIPLPFHKETETEKANPVIESNYELSCRFTTKFPFEKDGNIAKIMMVQSTTMNEGKTTVTSKLGKNFSDVGLRVLMMDLDIHHPSLHAVFGIDNLNGLDTAIDNISNYQLGTGSLDNFSVDDLFFLINLKKRSGILSIHNDNETIITYFVNGRLIHLQDKVTPSSGQLGNMLLNAGVINRNQLQDALERQKRTHQALGYILINAGYASREKLQGPLKLQMEEHLQKLFSWKTGTYTFNPGNVTSFENDRITFGESYKDLIDSLGDLEGSKFLQKEIFSRILPTQNDNLFILPAKSLPEKPIWPLNISLISKFLDILKHRFDVILIDSLPLDVSSGNRTLSALVDGVIFVIKAGCLSVKIINEAANSISDEKIMGAILNHVKTEPGYEYYYK